MIKKIFFMVLILISNSVFADAKENKNPNICSDSECRLDFMDKYPSDELKFWMLVAMEAKQGYSLDDVFNKWNKDKIIVIPDLDKAWMGSYYNLPLMRLDYREAFYAELDDPDSETRKKLDPIADEMLNELSKDFIERVIENISIMYFISIRSQIDGYIEKYRIENLKEHD